MYHRIVAAKVRQLFGELSRGNWQAMVDGLAVDFDYRFYGDNALSGHRTTRESMSAWWQRCFRLMGKPRFRLDDIVVSGGPWRTKVATAVTVDATLADGSGYHNIVYQFLELRWGKVTRIRTLEDTATLDRALDRCAAAGYAEAHAAPITDAPTTVVA